MAQLSNGTYDLAAPEPVGDTATLLSRLRRRAQGMQVIVGFDFPIGVPLAYAERAGISSFVAALPQFGHGRWSEFYDPAEAQSEIAPERPFYPRVPGGTSQRDLVQGLGVKSMDDLYRACEVSQERPKACSLFWTLGAAQVGRAAISGWREVLVPALEQSAIRVAVWPFHGDLDAVLRDSDCVLAETYPAEACLHIGLRMGGWSKRRQSDRQLQGDGLLMWAAGRHEVHISPGLELAIRDGFSAHPTGEDQFDAVVGLMSMLEVVTGHRSDGAPGSSASPEVEGWILGQQANTSAFESVAHGARDTWRQVHGALKRLRRLDAQDGLDVDWAVPPPPRSGDNSGGKNMTQQQLLATAGEAAPVIEALLALEGEQGICLLPRTRCLSMRVDLNGIKVPMLNIFATGVHFSRKCPCLYIDGKSLREARGQQFLGRVRTRLVGDALWHVHKVDMQCQLDHAFSEGEIRAVLGFVRWLRDQISKPDGAA